MTNLDQENVWKIVKEKRKSLLSQISDPECQESDTLLSDSYIKGNVDTIEEKLKLNTTITPNKNVSYGTLQFAADIFIYLPQLLSY